MPQAPPPLICPHCGTLIEKKTAISCPHCGADEHTAWGYLGTHSMDALPTTWGEDDDFEYDAFLEKEFGKHPGFSWKQWGRTTGLLLILFCIALYLLF